MLTHVIKYDDSENRPYPYVNLEISCVGTENYKSETGKIDTGASMTAISEHLVKSLNLKSRSSVWVSGFRDDDMKEYAVYHVSIKINDLVYKHVRVIAPSYRTNVLVGRDLINLWQMKLDGQDLTGEFISCSTDVRDAI